MEKWRIKLTDNIVDAMAKMAEGNPGAINVLLNIYKRGGDIDPDSATGSFGKILQLDSYGIYGSDIWILYSDICTQNLAKTLAVLRAVQLGFFDRKILKDACHRQDRSGKHLVPVEELYLKVKEELPNFDVV